MRLDDVVADDGILWQFYFGARSTSPFPRSCTSFTKHVLSCLSCGRLSLSPSCFTPDLTFNGNFLSLALSLHTLRSFCTQMTCHACPSLSLSCRSTYACAERERAKDAREQRNLAQREALSQREMHSLAVCRASDGQDARLLRQFAFPSNRMAVVQLRSPSGASSHARLRSTVPLEATPFVRLCTTHADVCGEREREGTAKQSSRWLRRHVGVRAQRDASRKLHVCSSSHPLSLSPNLRPTKEDHYLFFARVLLFLQHATCMNIM